MLVLVAWLFYETQSANKRVMMLSNVVQSSNRRELCIYAIISTLFGLSYVGRFVINMYVFAEENSLSLFVMEMLFLGVYLLEGSSMGAVMMIHYINFKKDCQLTDSKIDTTQTSILH